MADLGPGVALPDAVVAAVLLPGLARRRRRHVRLQGSRRWPPTRLYRYWNMVGVKDAHQESLVGQAGEIEPVYERYAMTFFVLADGKLHFPQAAERRAPSPTLSQQRQDGYLPVVVTTYRPPLGVRWSNARSARSWARSSMPPSSTGWSCGPAVPARGRAARVAVVPVKPSGFVRYGKTGQPLQADSQLSFLRYLPGERRLETNTGSGPVFVTAPAFFRAVRQRRPARRPGPLPVRQPVRRPGRGRSAQRALTQATDTVSGLCSAAFLWPFDVSGGQEFTLDLWLPVDDFRGASDFAGPAGPRPTTSRRPTRLLARKLDGSGMQATLPPVVAHLFAQYRSCRADLLILADDGEIHPGPTIYDSFWIRDSSVEAIACALAGDDGLAATQFGQHYLEVFQTGNGGSARSRRIWVLRRRARAERPGVGLPTARRCGRSAGSTGSRARPRRSAQGLLALRAFREHDGSGTTAAPTACCPAAGAPSTSATRTSRTTGMTCGGLRASTRRRGSPSGSGPTRSPSCGPRSTL